MKQLPKERSQALLEILKNRFTQNLKRHPNLVWDDILKKLETNPSILWSIDQMELTGGEPDIIKIDNEIYVVDCSKESPIGRRSLCYDQKALDARKQFKPENSALNMAEQMGVKLLNDELYVVLQSLGDFDTKTSSWLLTPKAIRDLGGALFGDKRYQHTWFYHNGADSYYKDRGFRGYIQL